MDKLDLSSYDTILFDMDGVLVDSEPLWKTAMYEVFSSLGSNLTKSDFQLTVGMRIDQVINYWKEKEHWEKTSYVIENQIIKKMIDLINEEGKLLAGVKETLLFVKSNKKIGLASSSPRALIDAVLKKTEIESLFDGIFSAENETHGKPHPGVYLTAAYNMGSNPSTCLVIEDSLNGVIAGKAANMTVICIPEKSHHPNPKLTLADFHFNNMEDLLIFLKTENNHT
jgi:HAD superfamily hydrolase (TIGR01509 family)